MDFSCCFGSFFDTKHATDESTINSQSALLNRNMADEPRRARRQKYGKKATNIPSTLPSFFTSPPRSNSDLGVIPVAKCTSRTPPTLDIDPVSTPAVASSPNYPPLNDVTQLLSNVHLNDDTTGTGDKERGGASHELTKRTTRSTTIATTSNTDSRLLWLQPLIAAYQKVSLEVLMIENWDTMLSKEWNLEKIAESSFAEVYKVVNSCGTSVLKIMALKPPKGPGARRETAVTVESVISEVLIMDIMAEIPGFLEFKACHIMEGKLPSQVVQAFDLYSERKGTAFPEPKAYHKDQLFMALELGDAGIDLENYKITTLTQLWDIALGVIIALAAGEGEYGFEHRDLHEGNVCMRQKEPERSFDTTETHRYGFSGLEITLLDYTLSRIEDENGHIIYRDLEQDDIFGDFEPSDLQRKVYRRMRNWSLFQKHGLDLDFPEELTMPVEPWKDFMPYTNIFWISYIIQYAMSHFTGSPAELKSFFRETKELRKMLDPDRNWRKAFESASEAFQYITERGWVLPQDTETFSVWRNRTESPPAGRSGRSGSYHPSVDDYPNFVAAALAADASRPSQQHLARAVSISSESTSGWGGSTGRGRFGPTGVPSEDSE